MGVRTRFSTSHWAQFFARRGAPASASASMREQEIKAASPIDNADPRPHDEDMTSVTKDVLDARLETIETRMDRRVASIEASFTGFVKLMDERSLNSNDRLGRMEASISETKGAISGLKMTMIVTGVSVVLAIVLGVAAFNATVLSNMLASFESGKNTSTAQAEVKKQSEETATLLKQIQDQLNHPPTAPARPAK